MSVVVITPPEPVVSLADAKAHLRVDDDGSDALIQGLIDAATEHLDGPAGWLGRALGRQVLQADFTAPWASFSALDLPFPPLVEVLEVSDTSMSVPLVVDASTWIGSAHGLRSLALSATLRRFTVTYRVGYDRLPAPIRSAILLMVDDLFNNRSGSVIDARAVVATNPTVERLLSPFRVWRV